MKVTMCTLAESVQIAGDNRRSWLAGRDEAEMWIDERGLLHIKRRGVHFATATFHGAWGADEKPAKMAKGAAKGVGDKVSDEALKP